MKKCIRGLRLLIIGFLIIFVNGCKKEKSKSELPEISVVNISKETNWDYWVVGKSDYYFLKSENSLPKSVLFHSSEAKKDYSIFFTTEGKLDKVAVDNYIFIFRNFNGSKVDIGIIDPEGSVKLLNAVETNIDWSVADQKGTAAIGLSYLVRWTGRIVGFVPCAISVAEAYSSLGLMSGVAGWTCGNYFLKLSADFEEHEGNVKTDFTDFENNYSLNDIILNCSTDAISCFFDLSADGYSELADYIEQFENEKSDKIQTVETAFSPLNNTTWDVTIFFNNSTSWHANVTFYPDHTMKYDEPANPGIYMVMGTWTSIASNINFNEPYIFDGTVYGNTMTGTFKYGTETKNWSAVKR